MLRNIERSSTIPSSFARQLLSENMVDEGGMVTCAVA